MEKAFWPDDASEAFHQPHHVLNNKTNIFFGYITKGCEYGSNRDINLEFSQLTSFSTDCQTVQAQNDNGMFVVEASCRAGMMIQSALHQAM